MNQPSGLKNMLRAAAGALPVVSRGTGLPTRTVSVEELPIDQTNVAEYAGVTGLRYGTNVPLTFQGAGLTYRFVRLFYTCSNVMSGGTLMASLVLDDDTFGNPLYPAGATGAYLN